jgi:uncharacterized protein (DUF302 family)
MPGIDYGFVKKLSGRTFDEAVALVTEALKKEGFGVLAQMDIREALRSKLGIDFRRYTILGTCNPVLARQALEAEPQIGLLLPCNVLVQESDDGGSIVSVVDPKAMFKLVNNPALDPIMQEAESRLRRVMDALSG